MARTLALLALTMLAACSRGPSQPCEPAPIDAASSGAEVTREAAPEPDSPRGLVLALAFGEGFVDVVTALHLTPAPAFVVIDAPSSVEATDTDGAIAAEVREGRLVLAREPRAPLVLRYRVASSRSGDGAWIDGRALLLPEGDAPCEIVLQLAPAETGAREVGSTLGIAAERSVVARPLDLRDLTFVHGTLEHARFEAREGRDVVASLGARSYDVRWVGAELALLRTRVDGWFGGLDAEPHTTFLLSVPAGSAPIEVVRSGIGVRALVREDVAWGAEPRLAVAQVLVRRWLGGVLRFEDDSGADAAWASYGFSRWVAQEILAEMGTLDAEERARDLTRLEAAIALAGPGDPRASMARGALYAEALDAALRARSAGTLRELLLELLAAAEDAGMGPLAVSAFEDLLARTLGDAERARFRASVLGDAPIELPRAAFGPCLRRGRATHRAFALGFDMPAHRAEPFVVSGLLEGSRAERAGVREGMRALRLDVDPADPTRPARLVLEDETELGWEPWDREARGYGWSRVVGVPETRC